MDHWSGVVRRELQLWRKNGHDTYQKMNGTLIAIETESDNNMKNHTYSIHQYRTYYRANLTHPTSHHTTNKGKTHKHIA